MNSSLSKIGVVIIGVNVEKYISACINSVKKCAYQQDMIEIVYVDGGSSDNSSSIAREFENITVIELNDLHPTPGRGRNTGWKSISAELIQFLDGDTLLDPEWFNWAVPEITDNVVAICGNRRERYPYKNFYHLIADIEWGYGEGLCKFFGGDVLVKRKILEDTGGYDEYLIAGEDPDLSYRIRHFGWSIKRINHHMTIHDIDMKNFKSYFKRAFRAGHAYAEISHRYIYKIEKMWLRETMRILIRSLLSIIIILFGIVTGFIFTGLLLGLLITVKPIFSFFRFKRELNKPWKDTIMYTVNAVIVVFPQLFGVLRYYYGLLFNKPLQNLFIKIK
jgi:glycosyltransferase involved in cell wall biosynthesis